MADIRCSISPTARASPSSSSPSREKQPAKPISSDARRLLLSATPSARLCLTRGLELNPAARTRSLFGSGDQLLDGQPVIERGGTFAEATLQASVDEASHHAIEGMRAAVARLLGQADVL